LDGNRVAHPVLICLTEFIYCDCICRFIYKRRRLQALVVVSLTLVALGLLGAALLAGYRQRRQG
jgi:hypothetical protein